MRCSNSGEGGGWLIFQNEDIFVQLDELDELDRIIKQSYMKHCSILVKVPDC